MKYSKMADGWQIVAHLPGTGTFKSVTNTNTFAPATLKQNRKKKEKKLKAFVVLQVFPLLDYVQA